MKCSHCGLREATSEVVLRNNGHIEKLYLCGECAKNFRPDEVMNFGFLNKLINGSPMGILSNLNNLFDTKSRTLICPECKTTSDDFLKTGFVGCPRCYEVFEPLIEQTVKRLQQSDRHVGKVPIGAVDIATEEARLKAELQSAVDRGDYTKIGELSMQLKKLVGSRREDK